MSSQKVFYGRQDGIEDAEAFATEIKADAMRTVQHPYEPAFTPYPLRFIRFVEELLFDQLGGDAYKWLIRQPVANETQRAQLLPDFVRRFQTGGSQSSFQLFSPATLQRPMGLPPPPSPPSQQSGTRQPDRLQAAAATLPSLSASVASLSQSSTNRQTSAPQPSALVRRERDDGSPAWVDLGPNWDQKSEWSNDPQDLMLDSFMPEDDGVETSFNIGRLKPIIRSKLGESVLIGNGSDYFLWHEQSYYLRKLVVSRKLTPWEAAKMIASDTGLKFEEMWSHEIGPGPRPDDLSEYRNKRTGKFMAPWWDFGSAWSTDEPWTNFPTELCLQWFRPYDDALEETFGISPLSPIIGNRTGPEVLITDMRHFYIWSSGKPFLEHLVSWRGQAPELVARNVAMENWGVLERILPRNI